MKKHSQQIELRSELLGPEPGWAGAMLSKSKLKKFADSLWMPSAIEDAHFENMGRQKSQSESSKPCSDSQ